MSYKRVLIVLTLACLLPIWAGLAGTSPPGETAVPSGRSRISGGSDRLAEPSGQAVAKANRVPYRMSETLHLIVRAKLNGKGPFNFIVDTGAPAMFVTTAVAKQVGADSDPDGWATFERMELEGGALVPNAKARVEDIFQIRGMNSLGLPGVRLDGLLGYNILARFRMEFNLSKSYMTWTELDFDPPLPTPLGGEGKGGAPPELEAVGNMIQMFAPFFRRSESAPLGPRGFLGVTFAERDGSIVIGTVLANSPADAAGLKSGDTIVEFAGTAVHNAAEIMAQAATIGPNETVRLRVKRGDESIEIKVTTGKGF